MNDQEFKRIAIIAGIGILGIWVLGHVPPGPIIVLGVLGFIAWRKGWLGFGNGHGNGNGPGPGAGIGPGWHRPSRSHRQPPRFFAEWHRRAHEGDSHVAASTSDDQPTVTSRETHMV